MLTYDPHPPEMERLLVYDLGGGTFDVSVAQVENGVVEIQASHGDTQLGGDDFDQLLLDHICDAFAKEHGIDLRQSLGAKARVLRAAEDAKKRLSSDAVTTIEEEFIAEKNGKSLNLVMEITRYDYEELIRPLLLKTLTCLDEALTDAKVQANQIDKVVLVGGATRTPLVHAAAGGTAGAPGPLRDRTRPGRRHGGGRPGGPDRRHRRRADPGRYHPAYSRHQRSGRAARVPVRRTHSRRSSSATRRCPPAGPRSTRPSSMIRTSAQIRVFQGENQDTRYNTLVGEF